MTQMQETMHGADPAAIRDRLDVMTEDEFAALVKIGLPTLKNWQVARKGPPFSRVGRAVLYFRDDVTRWLRENAT